MGKEVNVLRVSMVCLVLVAVLLLLAVVALGVPGIRCSRSYRLFFMMKEDR